MHPYKSSSFTISNYLPKNNNCSVDGSIVFRKNYITVSAVIFTATVYIRYT